MMEVVVHMASIKLRVRENWNHSKKGKKGAERHCLGPQSTLACMLHATLHQMGAGGRLLWTARGVWHSKSQNAAET